MDPRLKTTFPPHSEQEVPPLAQHGCLTHATSLPPASPTPPGWAAPSTMVPDVYQVMADRTKCSQAAALARLVTNNGVTSIDKMQLLHAVIGLGGEAGELCSLLQKWIWYGKAMTLDEVRLRVLEEFGDVMWYAAEAFNALGISFQEVLEANIRKLKARYPEKYTDTLAADENRDRAAEDKAMERGAVSGTTPSVADLDFIPGQWNDPAVEPGDRSGS